MVTECKQQESLKENLKGQLNSYTERDLTL